MELSIDELKSAPKPLIAHVGSNHFVVVVSYTEDATSRMTARKGQFTVMDPAKGLTTLTCEDFRQSWTGYVALLSVSDR